MGIVSLERCTLVCKMAGAGVRVGRRCSEEALSFAAARYGSGCTRQSGE